MVIVERPCCEAPLAVELPLAGALYCEECAVAWTVGDPATSAPRKVLVTTIAA